jgi:hypothetical protein
MWISLAGALEDDHVLDRLAAAHGEAFVDRGLSGISLPPRNCSSAVITATAPASTDAVLQALRGEAAEHHRVRRADAGAGLHRDDASIDIGM